MPKGQPCVAKQTRDPKTGRPEIESHLRFVDVPPPPPPPVKPKLNKPLPWKKQADSRRSASDHIRNLMLEATKANLEKQKAKKKPEEEPPPRPPSPQQSPDYRHKVAQTLGLSKPLGMGSARVLPNSEGAPPFSRDLTEKEQVTSRIRAIGHNPAPLDGHLKIRPMEPPKDVSVDPVFPERSVPKKPVRAVGPVVPEPKLDIFGKQQLTAQDAKERQAEMRKKFKEENDAQLVDHFSKVMKRQNNVLVEANRRLREEASKADTEKVTHKDPTVLGPVSPSRLDIFGRRALADKSDAIATAILSGSGTETSSLVAATGRKSMFQGDKERVNIFHSETVGTQTNQLGNTSASVRSNGYELFAGLPTYISAPPLSSLPEVADPIQNDSKKGTKGKAPPPNTDDHTTFYSTPLFKKLMFPAGMWGVRKLRCYLRSFDDDGDGILDRFQFRTALTKYGVDLTDQEMDFLMNLVPLPPETLVKMLAGERERLARKTQSGTSSPASSTVVPAAGIKSKEPIGQKVPKRKDESPAPTSTGQQTTTSPKFVQLPPLMDVLRRGAELPSARRQVVLDSYHALLAYVGRKNASLGITIDEIEHNMDFSQHPNYQPSVRGGLRIVVQGFYEAWGPLRNRSSVIMIDEFTEFYHDVSAAFASDADFVRMMRGMHSLKR